LAEAANGRIELHIPVLREEMLFFLRPRPGGVYLDGTLGAGGYAEAILRESAPDGVVVGMDLDPQAVNKASQGLKDFGQRLRAVHAGFHQAQEVLQSLGVTRIDGAVLDLGLSSDQLENPLRGFSFQLTGPLDMRFDTGSDMPLLDYLKTISAYQLQEILANYGDEKYCKKVARRVLDAVGRGELLTTTDLARLITQLIPRRRSKIHPATRTFQALRIALNREMENLDRALQEIPTLLKRGGRFCVVSYHSLEDRRVKQSFRGRQAHPYDWVLVTPKAVRPTLEEIRANPRSRSARMRVLEAGAKGSPAVIQGREL